MVEIERMEKPRRPAVLPGTKKRCPILAEAVYLDTETSHNYNPDTGEGHTWIYQWAFRWCRQTCIGRGVEELLDQLDRIDQENGLTKYGMRCVIYIHNASYDLSYLMPFLKRRYGSFDRVLATSPHKIITLEVGPWEFRCSYRLANRSLYKWGKDLGIKHGKKKGLIDYDVLRYPDSKLTRRDWIYQIYDVLALEECVLKELAAEGDTLRSIPLTSTGYVRRHGRKLARAVGDWKEFTKTKLDVETYKGLRFAFAGGLTHGNRFWISKTVRGNIRHRDFRSMYPSELRARKEFPAGPWYKVYEYEPGVPFSWDDYEEYKKDNCLLVTAIVRNVELKKGETLPYLQYSKCLLGASPGWKATVKDNGRVIKAVGVCVLTMTEIDWDILRRQYNFDPEPKIMMVTASKRGPIPEYLRELVDIYFTEKTTFKDLVKKLDAEGAPEAAILDAQTSLVKSKNRANGIFGMTATDPVRQDYTVSEECWEWEHTVLTSELIEEKLEKFYKSRNSFMRYQIGVYVTALARKDLMTMYWLIGPENFLYGDTDSIFYLSTPEIEERIEAENRRREAEAISNGAFIEANGKRVTYDAFELEKHKGETERITEFRFLHAKAYAYVTDDGELHVTVAGVSARDSKGYTREQELGNIENLAEGFVFKRCGSTTSVYLIGEPEVVDIDGHKVETAGGCVLLPTTKTLHDEYHLNKDIDWVTEPTRKEVKG